MTSFDTMPVDRLKALCDKGCPPQLIDVRTPGEFETAHIAGSTNIPLDTLRRNGAAVAAGLSGGPVVLVCRSGRRARDAAEALCRAGVSGVTVLDGGVVAWQHAGFAVERGRPRWELERQVRLVAGLIVLAAVLGSIAVPWLKWVAAAVGGGLVLAAITDTCALGMLLAKLPYNRGNGGPAACTVPAKAA